MLQRKILIIAAHPDDEILGCAGTISKEIKEQGSDCFILIMTDGGLGRYQSLEINQLKENALSASEILGVKQVFFENFPNQALETIKISELADCITKYIKEIEPDDVYTHHHGDINRDHKIINEATMIACRPLPRQNVKRLYAYNVPSSTEWNNNVNDIFVPNVFVDIKPYLHQKLSAMSVYSSECRDYPHPRSLESIKVHANYWGVCVGLEYAEPFQLIRELK